MVIRVWPDEIRQALRRLRRTPAFVLTAVLILGLGMGAATGLFSLVDGILLRPLPYHEPDRLVSLAETFPSLGPIPLSLPDFQDLQQQNHVFSDMAVYGGHFLTLTGYGTPRRLQAQTIFGDYLHLLGIRPLLGRTFTAREAARDGAPAVLISRALWVREFGADPHLLGQAIDLDGQPYTVIGVLPSGFALDQSADLCLPLDLHQPNMGSRGNRPGLLAIGRLRPGVTLAQAQSDVAAIAQRLGREYPQTDGGVGARVIDLHRHLQGDVREPLVLLTGAVGLLFLIACSNLAGLLLARGLFRQRELAVRMALGASRARLISEIWMEGLLLALAGGGLGWLIASLLQGVLTAALPENLPLPAPVAAGVSVLLFAFLLAVASALLFGLPPALQAASSDPAQLLQMGGSRSGDPRSHRLQRRFVVAEIALTMVLLASAGLLLRSFLHLLEAPNGFDAAGVLTAQISLPSPAYSTDARKLEFFTLLEARVRSLPGVESAGLTGPLPYDHATWETDYAVEGRPAPAESYRQHVQMFVSTPGYFRTMHIPLLQGRWFTAADEHPAPGAVLVSQRFAHRWWPGSNPVGRHIKLHTTRFADAGIPPLTVVGAVGDVRIAGPAAPPPLEVYMPVGQRTPSGMALTVRTRGGDPLQLTAAVRDAVRQLDPALPVYDVAAMQQRVSAAIATPRLAVTVLAAFAAMALLLAAVGLYGLMTLLVTQRRREIGIRMALGASAGVTLGIVLRQGMAMALTGLALGSAATLLAGRALSGALFGVRPWDPPTLAAAALVLCAIALLATWWPARRAASLDPIEVLRCE